jgi:Astacin (Peptidase family M12A)
MPKKATTAAAQANVDQWCFAWVPKVKGTTRAALLKDARWPQKSAITIGFLDGIPSVQKRVADAAKGWIAPGLAGLDFVFQEHADTMIRISFRYSGSWSVIGTQCLTVKHGQPTMNFGWLGSGSSDDEVQRVVLHEFGHALGLIHEHQNPLKNQIHWNKKQVYTDLSGPPNNWDKATIDTNMFDAYGEKDLNATGQDTTSIMMYPFPAQWTTDGVSTPLNTRLSTTDKKFIHFMYP